MGSLGNKKDWNITERNGKKKEKILPEKI